MEHRGYFNRAIPQIADDLGVSHQALRNWVRQADVDAGASDGLTIDERAEFTRMRREIRTLREEGEILKKAAAFFAKENDSNR